METDVFSGQGASHDAVEGVRRARSTGRGGGRTRRVAGQLLAGPAGGALMSPLFDACQHVNRSEPAR